jgi:hypothetical protein
MTPQDLRVKSKCGKNADCRRNNSADMYTVCIGAKTTSGHILCVFYRSTLPAHVFLIVSLERGTH